MNFVADNKNTNSLCTTNLGQAAYKGLSFDDYNAVVIMSHIFFCKEKIWFFVEGSHSVNSTFWNYNLKKKLLKNGRFFVPEQRISAGSAKKSTGS